MPEAKKVVKKVAEHPTYAVMVKAAVGALKERKGSSKQAIEKYVCANYKVGTKYNGPLKIAIRKLVENGDLTQVKGKGASGSFKIAKVEKPAKKVVAKKPAAKKAPAKKAPAKKAPAKKTAAKKPAAKKPPAKKSPVKKAPAKKTAPKKVVKKTTKKVAAKKPAAKKAKK